MSNSLLPTAALPRQELKAGLIHIWHACLDQPTSRFQGLLSTDERARAGRYYFEKDWRRYIVRRGILRKILAGYLGTEPGRLRFCYGANGKPMLSNTYSQEKIHFNLSHSEGLALYAFTRDREIGVDIEFVREVPEMEQIVANFFPAGERADFETVPESMKKEAFFNGWTRKEAFIKATGGGLSLPLDSFEVSLAPGEPARLLAIEGDPAAAARWSVLDLATDAGFAAALAVKGQIGDIQYRQWAN